MRHSKRFLPWFSASSGLQCAAGTVVMMSMLLHDGQTGVVLVDAEDMLGGY